MRSKRGRSSSAKSLGNGAVGVSLLISWTRPNNPSSDQRERNHVTLKYVLVFNTELIPCFMFPKTFTPALVYIGVWIWDMVDRRSHYNHKICSVQIWRFSEDRQTLPRTQGALLINGERFTVLFRLPNQMDRTELSIENLDCLERLPIMSAWHKLPLLFCQRWWCTSHHGD